MSLATNLLAGILASLLAVAIIEAYHFARRHLEHRPLRLLLDGSRPVTVVVPVFPANVNRSVIGSLTGTYDAYATAHILEAYRRIGITPPFASVGNLPDDLSGDVVAIGGHHVNEVTKYNMQRFCPGFLVTSVEDKVAYQCGDEKLIETDSTTWAFIVRLDAYHTGRDGMTLLLWGYSAIGTAAAGFYVAQHADSLPAKRTRSFSSPWRSNGLWAIGR